MDGAWWWVESRKPFAASAMIVLVGEEWDMVMVETRIYSGPPPSFGYGLEVETSIRIARTKTHPRYSSPYTKD
jgi:hypothetical protein